MLPVLLATTGGASRNGSGLGSRGIVVDDEMDSSFEGVLLVLATLVAALFDPKYRPLRLKIAEQEK